MNQELLINLGSGTQTVREAEQPDIHPHSKRRDYFLPLLLCRIWVSTWYLSVTQESQNIRTQKKKAESRRRAGGEPDAACVLMKVCDLLIVICFY